MATKHIKTLNKANLKESAVKGGSVAVSSASPFVILISVFVHNNQLENTIREKAF